MSTLRLDHVVYAAPDLERAVGALEKRLGVRATPGGQHTGLGTRNALLALGPDQYLEVIGPDPEQPAPARARPFGVDGLEAPRLVTWAVKAPDLDSLVARARERGYDPGIALDMERATPTGERLEWRLSFRPDAPGDGLVPFLIDWGKTASPAASCATGCRLLELRAEHPDPEAVGRDLEALGTSLRVDPGPAPGLVCRIETPAGAVELR